MMKSVLDPELQTTYELVAILAGSLPEAEQKKLLAKVGAECKKVGAIKQKDLWPRHALAYRIQKENTGTYLIIVLATTAAKISDLEIFLRLEPRIIRHLISKLKPDYKWRKYEAAELEADPRKVVSKEALAREGEPVKLKKEPELEKKKAPLKIDKQKLDNLLAKI